MELKTVLVAVAVIAVALFVLNATVFKKKKSRFEPADFSDYAPAETYYDGEAYEDAAGYDGYGEPEATSEYYQPEPEYYEGGEPEYYEEAEYYEGGEPETYEEAEYYEGGEAEYYEGGEDAEEDDDEYAAEEDDDEYAEEDDDTEDFTLMEPTIDDKYANALFTPPLI